MSEAEWTSRGLHDPPSLRLNQVVTFSESGEERMVVGFCRRCGSDHAAFQVVSSTGIAHVGAEYGKTACGRDATKPTWWWQS